eukprot:TRINITY_DN9579_c0_g1_i1.p1 TRINITY_DN9579_c0_g1~~TRINITY_DN9579_c0_g1_i1.p1  ORF type:complete len:326 (+),score=18.44 TRINITY_DN9579_c0_g1_i1:107-1084(+)
MSFPIQNVINILMMDEDAAVDTVKGKGIMAELAVRHLRLSTYVLLAMIYHFTFNISVAHQLSWSWIAYLWVRNIILGLVFYGGWHVFLYELEFVRSKMHRHKFNQRYPSHHQHRRDAFWTLSGLTISTLFEATMYHLWATKSIPMYTNFWDHPLWSVIHVLYVAYWRDMHFFCIHRFMHPWKLKGCPDVGKWMYTNVHYLHHKSYNTGPLSGLAMHPIEHILYYTCTLLPLVFTLHPIHFLYNKLHADVSPVSGHDGHEKPGGGSYFHYLHHHHYEVNYGTPMSLGEEAGARRGQNEVDEASACFCEDCQLLYLSALGQHVHNPK